MEKHTGASKPNSCENCAMDLKTCDCVDSKPIYWTVKSALFNAYCFASGQIQFGVDIPEGAIGIATGHELIVRELISATARLSRHDNETLFVPGVPEAETERAGLTALARYIQYLVLRNKPGFRALGV